MFKNLKIANFVWIYLILKLTKSTLYALAQRQIKVKKNLLINGQIKFITLKIIANNIFDLKKV